MFEHDPMRQEAELSILSNAIRSDRLGQPKVTGTVGVQPLVLEEGPPTTEATQDGGAVLQAPPLGASSDVPALVSCTQASTCSHADSDHAAINLEVVSFDDAPASGIDTTAQNNFVTLTRGSKQTLSFHFHRRLLRGLRTFWLTLQTPFAG